MCYRVNFIVEGNYAALYKFANLKHFIEKDFPYILYVAKKKTNNTTNRVIQ